MHCPNCHLDNPEDSKFCKECGTQITPLDEGQLSFTKTLASPREKLTTGLLFAERYKIIKVLGRGGMGEVYHALDTQINEEVAIKLIKPEIAQHQDILERFSNELKLSRKISNKHVCRMYHLEKKDETPYITMEYIEGEDLKALIKQKGKFSSADAVTLAQQICEGLFGAHDLGIVHRDLKPQNIMIDQKGDAKIMDFGIARSLEAASITQSGMIIGTPDYFSPEQAEGEAADHRSDIYSLGVILYEMVTGSLPFRGDTALSIALKHKSQIPLDPRKLNPDISGDLSRLILICMEKDKEGRYQSAADLLNDLRNIEEGLPLGTKLKPKRKTLATTLLQSKALIPVAAALFLAVAALTFVLFKQRGPDLGPNRVVVLIFENQTGDPKLDPIGHMAAEMIRQGLSRTGIVDVVSMPPDKILQDAEKSKDPIRFLAEKTSAAKVISGSYYLQEGENLQLYAQILDAQQGGKLLASIDPANGSVADPGPMIEEMQKRVMGGIAVLFDNPGAQLDTQGLQPPTYESFREYKQGKDAFNRNEFVKAIKYFERALELDPDYYEARYMIGWCYANRGDYDELEKAYVKMEETREKLNPLYYLTVDLFGAMLRGDVEEKYNIRRQLALAEKIPWLNYSVGMSAVDLNRPKEALEWLESTYLPYLEGWIPYWGCILTAHHMLGNYKKQLKIARQTREMYPDSLRTLLYEALAQAALGRIGEVNKLMDEIVTLPPQAYDPPWVLLLVGRELRAHGHREASIQVLERAVAWYRTRPQEEAETQAHRYKLAEIFYKAERWAEAKNLFKALHKEFPEETAFEGYLGVLAAREGDKEEALRISRIIESTDEPYQFGQNTIVRARIAALLGEKETAVRLIREALSEGLTYFYLHPEMDLEPLFDYPPFIELMEPKG